MLASVFTLHRLPGWRFLNEALTMRTALIGAGFLTMVSVALASEHMGVAFSCAPGQHMLVYPHYNKRGIIVDTINKCGEVHRGCVQRNDSMYDCSPFMAPTKLKIDN